MKKFLAILVLVLIVIGYFNMPGMVESAIPTAYYITPNKKTYENVVNCTGSVQSANVREIYVQSPIVASEVCVDVGDSVKAGALLVHVDLSLTEQLNASAMGLLSSLPANGLSSGGSGVIDWVALASQFGLSAAISGSNDLSALHAALGSGASAASNPGYIVKESAPSAIYSTLDGTITDINVFPNTPTNAGKAIMTITDMEHFKVLASVSESDIAKIAVGDAAKVRGVGFGGNIYHGTVEKIYPTAYKSLSGTEAVVDVEITLSDSDQNLKPGFSAKVEITGGNRYDMITVPYEAVRQDENNDEYVYLYEDGKLKKQVVVTGQELTNVVEILEGLSRGSVVVYNPSELMKEGAMIQIKGRADTE